MSSTDNENNTTTATIHWSAEGTPVATNYDDVYFSVDNGLAETRYVFIEQNQLTERWLKHHKSSYVIAETGFGTGLNFLATWQHYQQFLSQHPSSVMKRLHFISFEKHPLAVNDLSQALAQWPELSAFTTQLVKFYPTIMTPGCHRLSFKHPVPITLDIWIGDVHQHLPEIPSPAEGLVHSWFLDGFAPSKNPDMWSQDLFNGMAKLSTSHASFATFTAAGFVRRGLISAGFTASKTKGFGRKREMLVGQYQTAQRQPELTQRLYHRSCMQQDQNVAIIGAGIAGASLAYALVKRGIRVSIYEQASQAASEASGNRQGAVYPLLSPNQPHVSEFFQHAFHYQRQVLEQLSQQGLNIEHQYCGLLQLNHNSNSAKKHQNIAQAGYAKELVYPVSAEQASKLANLTISSEALYYPQAGWVNARQCVEALLSAAQQSGLLSIHYHHRLKTVAHGEQSVQLHFENATIEHDNVVFCNAHQLLALEQGRQLPLTPVRGQVSHIQSSPKLAKLSKILCYEGYLTPANNQQHCIGASYKRNNLTTRLDEQEGQANLQSLRDCQAQEWNSQLAFAEPKGRAAVRCVVRDHFPLLGQLPDLEQLYQADYLQHWQQQSAPAYPRCYVAVGFGSRGICSAPFAGELLAAQLCGEPIPLKQTALNYLHPHRFWNRRLLKKRPLALRYR